MTISFEYPPEGTSAEIIDYLQRFIQAINLELSAASNVSIRNEVPERPREGHIYYLQDDLSDSATVGYYVYMKDAWYKVDLTPQSPPESATRTYV